MAPTIAVIGSSGFLGGPVVDALTTTFADKVALPIIATTRSTKGKTDTDKLKYVEAELTEDNLDRLYEIFQGVDVVIELVGANKQSFAVIEQVVARTQPKLFIPSQFGTDLQATDAYLPNFLKIKSGHTANARRAGVKTVDIYNGLFAIVGAHLYEKVASTGIDADALTVQYFGDPDLKFGVSKLVDVGHTVAALATASDYAQLPNEVRIYSDLVSQRDIARRYEATHNVTLRELAPVSQADALRQLQEKLGNGFDNADFSFYLHAIVAQGEGKGATSVSNNEREFVNPGEKLWKWDHF